jgi:hypothetical protein
MVEGTHTSEAGLFRLVKGGRGKCLYAGVVTLAASGDTLDTGLDSIDAAVITPEGELAGSDEAFAITKSGGTITITSLGANAMLAFDVIAVGTVR